MRILVLFLTTFLILATFTPELSHAQNWPHFSPAGFDFKVGIAPVSVAMGDFDGDSHQDFAVASVISEDVTILLGTGKGSFSEAAHLIAGDTPVSIAVGDFNEDGHQDLVVGSTSFAILLGRGDGSFEEAIFYDLGIRPRTITVGDFNEDDHLDLAVISNGVCILLGDGQGMFESPVFYSVGTNPKRITLGDFDEDGHQDLAVVNSDNNDVAILLGRGDGSFEDAMFYDACNNPRSVTTGDFNEDGHQDLVISRGHEVAILLGNGNGSFQRATFYTVGGSHYPQSVSVGDFDEDGHQDLVTSHYGSKQVAILSGNGDGTFQTAVFYGASEDSDPVIVGDFDEDGHQDLAVNNYYFSNITILLGNGDGSFQVAPNYLMPFPPWSIAVGDFDEDGHQDLAVANSEDGENWGGYVSIMLGIGDGEFGLRLEYYVGELPYSLAIGDFNEDGHQDLAVTAPGMAYNTGCVTILAGSGDGSFQVTAFYIMDQHPKSIAIGDFDEDGHQDLAVVVGDYRFYGDIGILLGNGDGSFQAATFYDDVHAPKWITIGDLNEDSHQDLVVVDFTRGEVAVLLGNGDGSFQAATFYDTIDYPLSVAISDFNEDGHQDMVVSFDLSDDIAFLPGNGNGSFETATYFKLGGGRSLTVGDFNEDGHQDLAMASYNHNCPYIFTDNDAMIIIGNGDGSFQPTMLYSVGVGPRRIALGDFDGDGHCDLAVSNQGLFDYFGSVTVLMGNWKEIDAEIDCLFSEILRGESLPISMMLSNHTDNTITFQVVLSAKIIGGTEFPLLGPRTITLTGGQEIKPVHLVHIPDNMPVGEYVLTLKATALTDEILDEDSFRVKVVGYGKGEFFENDE